MQLFLAKWDEAIGPTLIEDYQEGDPGSDLDALAIQIFMTFQTVFGDSTEVEFNRTFLTFPFKSMNQIGRIILDTLPNSEVRGGKEPFIIVALLPDYIGEEQLIEFDPILQDISNFYIQSKNANLAEFYLQIQKKIDALLKIDDFKIEIKENYTLTLAINDFKKRY